VSTLSKYGDFPAESEGLSALIDKGEIAHLSKDPWGNPYQYHYVTGRVVSFVFAWS
jgi:hypothetical protein